MNEFLTDVLYIVGSYFGVVAVIFFLLQWQTKGFIGSLIRVKGSKGKRVLVICHTRTDTYYRSGMIEGDALRYKGRDKKPRTYEGVPEDAVYSQMGVYCIEYDEVARKVLNRLKTKASEQDPVVVDGLLQGAVESPSLKDKTQKIMLLLAIGTLLAVLVVGYLVVQNAAAIEALEQISGLIQ